MAAVESALGPPPKALRAPHLTSADSDAVLDALASGDVSTYGKWVAIVEKALASRTGAAFAIATNSGTSALHLAYQVVGVSSNTEVLMAPISFVATANAAVYCGAEPHFVDIDPDTLSLSPDSLEKHLSRIARKDPGGVFNALTGRRLSAVVCVDVLGRSGRVAEIKQICQEFGIPLVEDAAEAMGSTFLGKHSGTQASVGCLSFNGNKIITAGAGGAVLTDCESTAVRLQHLAMTARKPHPIQYDHDGVGFNYKMASLNAALLKSQLQQLDKRVDHARNLYALYALSFRSSNSATLMSERVGEKCNFWLQAIELNGGGRAERDEVIQALNRRGYESRPLWNLLSSISPYRTAPRGDLTCAESKQSRVVCLPSNEAV